MYFGHTHFWKELNSTHDATSGYNKSSWCHEIQHRWLKDQHHEKVPHNDHCALTEKQQEEMNKPDRWRTWRKWSAAVLRQWTNDSPETNTQTSDSTNGRLGKPVTGNVADSVSQNRPRTANTFGRRYDIMTANPRTNINTKNQIKSYLFAQIYMKYNNCTSYTLSRTARLNKCHWQLHLMTQ